MHSTNASVIPEAYVQGVVHCVFTKHIIVRQDPEQKYSEAV